MDKENRAQEAQNSNEDIKELKESVQEIEQQAKELEERVTTAENTKEIKEDLESSKEPQEESQEDTQTAKENEDTKSEQETKENKPLEPTNAKNKNLIAQKKIEEVRESVKRVEKEVQEVVDEVKAKIEEFEEYEANVLNRVIATAKERLKDIGFEEEEKEIALAKAEITTKEKPLSINDISSGAGGAFVTGVLGALATVAGWCIYASKVQGVPFPPQKVPNLNEIAAKFSALANSLGAGESAPVGGAIVIGSALVVFLIIYKVMVSMRASKNLEISKKIEEDAKEYSQRQLEFKEMVQKIGEHVDELRATTCDFEVLLEEKSASLKRAKRFEDVESFDELNPKTKECANDTNTLVVGLEKLLAAPMAKDAILNEESINALKEAKELVSVQVEKIYK